MHRFREAERKIQRIAVAADNLRAAGLNDIGEDLTRRVGDIKRELREARTSTEPEKRPPGKPDPGPSPRFEADPQEIRAQNERLRVEAQEIRAQNERLR